MAAGLPVIVTDWDGMKDTVTPEVGFRIPTELPRAGLSGYVSQRYLGGTDSYVQYVSQMSAMTIFDVPAFAQALVTLATDADLRARMGAMGQARARDLYDWRAIIPQMQALWGEQVAMLAHARTSANPATATRDPDLLPVGPAVEEMFAAYPTARAAPDRRLCAVDKGNRPGPRDTFELRNYAVRRRMLDDPARIETVLAAYAAAGAAGATEAEIAAVTRIPVAAVGRISLWLLKYHFLQGTP
jgi:hypothetical protein